MYNTVFYIEMFLLNCIEVEWQADGKPVLISFSITIEEHTIFKSHRLLSLFNESKHCITSFANEAQGKKRHYLIGQSWQDIYLGFFNDAHTKCSWIVQKNAGKLTTLSVQITNQSITFYPSLTSKLNVLS